MNQPQIAQFSAIPPPPQYATSQQPQTTAKPKSQVCGTIIAVILGLLAGKGIVQRAIGIISIKVGSLLFFNQCFHLISNCLRLFFFTKIVYTPEFLAGKPSLKKFTVLFVDLFINSVRMFILICFARLPPMLYNPLVDVFAETIFFILTMAMYNHSDYDGSCCICFKPWAYREIEQMYPSYPGKPMPSNPYVNATNPNVAYNYPTRSYPYPGYNQPLQPQPQPQS